MITRVSFVVFAALALCGCVIVADVDADWDWAGNWVERERSFDNVAQVEFNARGTLYIIQGKRNELQFEGNEDALKQLHIDERDGTLIISQAGDNYRWFELRGKHEEPVYTLEINDIEQIVHSGHGEINVGPFTLETLSIKTSGHAQTYIASINARSVLLNTSEHGQIRIETLDSDTMQLNADDHAEIYIQDANVLDTKLRTQSHADIWLAGQSDSLDVKMRDHSGLEAGDFAAAIATIRASDHAKAQLQVSSEINLDQRDKADVVVLGEPQVNSAGD